MTIEWTHETAAGEEVTERIPAAWAICETCEGHGHHSDDFGAITADEWHGPDWDDDSREAYVGGRYDKACADCGGTGKVRVADEERTPADLLARWQAHLTDEAVYQEQCRRERAMGY